MPAHECSGGNVVDVLGRFRAAHPNGGVEVTLKAAGASLMVRARIYRVTSDRRPATSAIAVVASPERFGGGDAHDRAVRDAERRAIGRALMRLRALDSRASGEPATVRRAHADPGDPYAIAAPLRTRSGPPRSTAAVVLAERVTDLRALIASSARFGVRPQRTRRWQQTLGALRDADPETIRALERLERRLRRWLARQDPA